MDVIFHIAGGGKGVVGQITVAALYMDVEASGVEPGINGLISLHLCFRIFFAHWPLHCEVARITFMADVRVEY